MLFFNKKIKIGKTNICKGRAFIVAEVSANHAGNYKNLKKLIDNLSRLDIDAVKVQAYQANTITLNSNKADFKIKKKNKWADYKNLFNLYKNGETPFEWLPKIFKYCKKKKITIFASVFDESSLRILEKLKCPAYKIASPEITDIPLIEKVAKTKKPIIISNGLANFQDLKLAVNSVKKQKNKKLIILKCT